MGETAMGLVALGVVFVMFFFFFQAEDGIRDLYVTGVQTCALPILEVMQGKGQVEPDEDVLEDGIAFAGVAKFPARVKCALLSWMAFKDAALQVRAQGETA